MDRAAEERRRRRASCKVQVIRDAEFDALSSDDALFW